MNAFAETLTDGTVRLRAFALSDAPVLTAADRDPEHRRRFDTPEDFTASLEHSLAVLDRWSRDGVIRYAAEIDGELAGGVELRQDADARANLSYWTYPNHRGRGLAPRMVSLLVEHAFAVSEIARVQAFVEADNAASRIVCRKAGLDYEGALRAYWTSGGQRRDVLLFAAVKGTWAS